MWVLIVISLHGGASSTQSSLADCERELARIVEAQQAYCQSAFSNDMVWFIKDGRHLIEPGTFH